MAINVGLCIIIFCVLCFPVGNWVKNLYLMFYCLKHGGDWKYYRDVVVEGLWFAGFFAGFGLVIFGLYEII